VLKLVKDTGFPGMKVLEFAFDSREESDYLPHNYTPNCIVYTGTHDNNTIKGWYEDLKPEDRQLSIDYMNNASTPKEQIHWDFIRLALASVAKLAVIPVQDYLGLGGEARINVPSTLGKNWRWRLLSGEMTDELAHKCRKIARLYGRV
jgi:4-alpha-glucanotransferase